MSTNEYGKKLLDPRWQRKRAEILARDNFTCVACGDADSTLHVHHGYYAKDRDPWDYENDTLWTLCSECHEAAEDFRQDARMELGRVHPTEHDATANLLNTISQKRISPALLQRIAFNGRYKNQNLRVAGIVVREELAALGMRKLYQEMSEWIACDDCWERVCP